MPFKPFAAGAILALLCLSLFFSCDGSAPHSWSSDQEPAIQDIVDSVDRDLFDRTFAALNAPRYAGMPPADLAPYEQWLTDELSGFGYQVLKEPVDGVSGWTGTEAVMNNIYAVKDGTDPSLAPIYITAHWDTVPSSPGINDNGSGCAAVLAAAELLQGRQTARDIWFILFSREEEWLLGSFVRAAEMKRNPAAVLNMDLIGYTSARQSAPEILHLLTGMPRKGDFIGLLADSGSLKLARTYTAAAERFVPALKYFVIRADGNLNNQSFFSDIFRSDHSPFWEKGVPALFITDTAEMRDGSPYHTEWDTVEAIDFDFMLNTARATIATLCVLAGLR